jgi:hypothetical protein
MGLYYQTEYRLGSRGRVCRSYTGFQAFVAIAFDLLFGLIFEMVATLISMAARLVVVVVRLAVRILKIHWRILVAAMTLVVYLLTLPFALLHQAVDRLRWHADSGRPDPGGRPTGKPDWVLGREV